MPADVDISTLEQMLKDMNVNIIIIAVGLPDDPDFIDRQDLEALANANPMSKGEENCYHCSADNLPGIIEIIEEKIKK